MKNMTIDTEKTQAPDRRRHYVISKKFQRNFSVSFLILGLIVATGTLAGLWYFSAKEINFHLYRTHFIPSNAWKVVVPIMLNTSLVFLLALLIGSLVLTRLIFKRLSFKFETFNTALKKIGDGDLSVPVPQEKINSLNKKLEETRISLNRRVAVLRSIQKEIKDIAAKPVYDEKVMKDLESLSISFKNKLSQFKYK